MESKIKRTIVVGSDHAGFLIKERIVKYLTSLNAYELIDVGTNSEESVDFPDYSEKLCLEVLKDKERLGIIVCGSGIGVSISCNKLQGIRCALVHDYLSAKMSRLHTGCNVAAIGGNFVGPQLAENIVDAFLSHDLLTEEKYSRRINKITALEKKYLAVDNENKNI